jgi:hypothetical protein
MEADLRGNYIEVPWDTMDTVADISAVINKTAYRRALKGNAEGKHFFLGKDWDISKMSESTDLKESIIDPTRDALDFKVFKHKSEQSQPILREDVRGYLLGLAKQFSHYGSVTGAYIVGSILSYQWLPTSDLDLHIVMAAGEEAIQRAFDDPQRKVGFLPGTRHDIQIYIEPDELAIDHYDGVYDLIAAEWVKGPYDESVDAEAFLTIYRDFIKQLDISVGELKRDLIDYEILRELEPPDLSRISDRTKIKLQEINGELRWLSGARSIIRALRDRAFRTPLTPTQIKELGSHQQVPENILYKLLERYEYMKLLNAVSTAVDNGGLGNPEAYGELRTAVLGTEESALSTISRKLDELTGAGAAGAYDVPFGQKPVGQRRKKRKRRKEKSDEKE